MFRIGRHQTSDDNFILTLFTENLNLQDFFKTPLEDAQKLVSLRLYPLLGLIWKKPSPPSTMPSERNLSETSPN